MLIHVPRFLSIVDSDEDHEKAYTLFDTEEEARLYASHFVSNCDRRAVVIALDPKVKINGDCIYKTKTVSKLVRETFDRG